MAIRISSTAIAALVIVLSFASFAHAADWQSEDIGDTKVGSTAIENGVFTIEANGADIFGTADAFRFVYQEIEGDFGFSARVVSLERIVDWTKAGIMARQSVEPDSPHVFVHVTPDHGAKVIHRDTQGAETPPNDWEGAFDFPVYIKLEREGNSFFTYYRAENAGTWEEVVEGAGLPNQAELEFSDPIFVGLAVTSHSAGTLATAVFDNLEAGFLAAVNSKGKVAAMWGEIKSMLQ